MIILLGQGANLSHAYLAQRASLSGNPSFDQVEVCYQLCLWPSGLISTAELDKHLRLFCLIVIKCNFVLALLLDKADRAALDLFGAKAHLSIISGLINIHAASVGIGLDRGSSLLLTRKLVQRWSYREQMSL